MQQLLQDISSGDLTVTDVPAPVRAPAALLVATLCSLISAGTERAVMEMGSKSLAAKARARPDLARKVVDSVREEGLRTAVDKVRGRLGEPNPLGYSSCGVVLEAPADSPAGPGELVACAGAGYAGHAEIVSVPRTLCARVPEGVEPEQAAYATVCAIALHGVRLCGLQLGDVAAVIGLGLVGQLTLELLRAAGCVALGVDPDERRVALAREAGFFATTTPGDLVAEAGRLTAGRGADGALVTAASRSAAPLADAIEVARERATVCVVGDVPIESPRTPLFAKELNLVVSRSYGPGRYDPSYEEGGHDYPAGYVRWTEGRNLEEVLRLMAAGALQPQRLTTHRYALAEAPAAYALLNGDEPSVGIVLDYPQDAGDQAPARVVAAPPRRRRTNDRVRIGVIGAGAFARTVLLPALAKRADIYSIVTATGPSGQATASRFGARAAGTDPALVLEDPNVDAVVIATRHDTHADYAARALMAGKHVFVEKPLALDAEQLASVRDATEGAGAGTLMVGFNRRHAPLAVRLRDELGGRGPLLAQYRVNAGRIPRSSWVHDPEIGGGRIVGELCHFVDFASFLAGGTPTVQSAVSVEGSSEPREDTLVTTLSFPDGSVVTIAYSALGDAALGKERVEVMGEAGAAVLDDFRALQLFTGGKETMHKGSRDKGHTAEIDRFVTACRTGRPVQPLDELMGVMTATFQVRDLVRGVSAEPVPAR